MATPEETRAGDGAVAEALQSMTEGDAAPSSRPEHQTRARAPTDSADAASAANAAAPSDASGTLEALAALRVADDAGDESEDAPVVPRAPDVFDRLGYGDSASEGGDGNGDDGDAEADVSSSRDESLDESSSDDDEYDDERETDDAATLFLDTIVAVADGEIPLDAAALGSMARALAREVGVVLEDDDLTLLADAPRAVQVAVRRVSDLTLALTLAPPDLARRAPGGALVPQPVVGSFRIVTLEIVAALVGCSIMEAREAVARCPVRARRGGGAAEAGTSGRDGSADGGPGVLTPVTAAAAMLFAYEQSTPLQCAAARVLCAALTAAEERAWAPLLRKGWGTAAVTERVAPPATSAEEAERQALSLPARLAAVAEEAVRVRPGARRCGVGMAMIVAETLRHAHAEAEAFEGGAAAAGKEERLCGADRTEPFENVRSVTRDGARDDGWSKTELLSALRSDARWRAACDDDDGAFRRFEGDVCGGLCGPRPSRVASIEDFASGAMGSPKGHPFGGGSMSGGDVLQALQRLGGLGVAAQAGPAQ